MRAPLLPLGGPPWVVAWGSDDWSFNLPSDDEEGGDAVSDGSGLPGRQLVGCAVARWMASSPHADAAMVASVFNLPDHLARDALRPVDLFPTDFVPSDLVDALMVWSSCVGGSVPIDLAAAVFGVPVDDVLVAIDGHHWMFVDRVDGVSCIGHEGE